VEGAVGRRDGLLVRKAGHPAKVLVVQVMENASAMSAFTSGRTLKKRVASAEHAVVEHSLVETAGNNCAGESRAGRYL